MIIKKKKEKTCTLIDVAIPADRMLCKRSGKGVEIQEFMYRDTTNVEPEMYDYTNSNCSHWNSNEKLKEKFGNCTRKTLDRFTISSLQKTAILGITKITRKVLQSET